MSTILLIAIGLGLIGLFLVGYGVKMIREKRRMNVVNNIIYQFEHDTEIKNDL